MGANTRNRNASTLVGVGAVVVVPVPGATAGGLSGGLGRSRGPGSGILCDQSELDLSQMVRPRK